MPSDSMLGGESEYGLAEAAILSRLSAATMPDELTRPAIVTAQIEPREPRRRIIIRGPNLFLRIDSHRPMPATFLTCVRAVADLLNLPQGWNSYSARPIAPENAAETIRVLADFLEPQMLSPAVVPRVQGGIQLEWHTEDIDIEVYIDSPDRVHFFAELVASSESFEGSLPSQGAVLNDLLRKYVLEASPLS